MITDEADNAEARVRVGAVSYLNTVPLVWGMLHGEQRDEVDLTFSIPSLCAEQLEDESIDVGILPVAEIARQELEIVSSVGITCLGAVRSILLSTRKPFREVRTLAADLSSRTSVQLARVILRERYGVEPAVFRAEPDMDAMLQEADAALVIGDPALRIDPAATPWQCLDLGAEWFALTGLPMVFAAWAAKRSWASPARVSQMGEMTRRSYEEGAAHLDIIARSEYVRRGISLELAREYLTRYIRYEIGSDERRGLQAFYEMAGLLRSVPA